MGNGETRDGRGGVGIQIEGVDGAGSRAGRSDERLLCARTYDARDVDDVERVKRALLGLGLRD